MSLLYWWKNGLSSLITHINEANFLFFVDFVVGREKNYDGWIMTHGR